MERILQQRYRVVRSLGRGGLGAVSLCDDLRLPGKQWAVKQMHNPEPALHERFRESFEREAATLSRIRHPNLPVIVDYFEQDGSLYLVMEYVEGENLAEYVRRKGHLAEREAFEHGLVLVELLGYLHAQDPPIIFRDLKPENVMITPDGVLKLVDFGLARRFVPGKRSDTVPSGSVGYAAPEQWEDLSQTDERSDVYSWGATLIHLLTGRIPSPVFPLSALRGLEPPISEPGRAILARCLKARVNERYASASTLALAISGHLDCLAEWEAHPGAAPPPEPSQPPTAPPHEAPDAAAPSPALPSGADGSHAPHEHLVQPPDTSAPSPRSLASAPPGRSLEVQAPGVPLPPEPSPLAGSLRSTESGPLMEGLHESRAARPRPATPPAPRNGNESLSRGSSSDGEISTTPAPQVADRRPTVLGGSQRLVGAPLLLLLVATVAYILALLTALPRQGATPESPAGTPVPVASPVLASRPDVSTGVGPHQMHRNEKTASARKLYEQGRWAEAIGVLDRVTTQFPEDAEAHILKENAYIQLQRLPSITIPYIGSMTGTDSAEFSSQLHGLALAQATVNLRGGVRNRKIIIDLYDDESSTSRCLALAETLVRNPQTLVVIGPYNSQRTLAVAPIFDAAHVNLVAATASAERVWQSGPYVMSAADSTEKRVQALARYVVHRGFKKVALVLDEGSRISHEMRQSFDDEVRRARVETLEIPSYTEDQTRFDEQIAMIQRLSPDVIFVCEYRAIQTARLATALRKAGITIPICAQTIPFTRELVDLGGSAVDGLLLSAFFHPHLETPRCRTFVAAFHNKFGPLTPTHLSACTFDAFEAVCQGLEHATTRQALNQYLRAAGSGAPAFEGIVGPFAMARALDERPIWIIEVRNGRFRLLEQATPPASSAHASSASGEPRAH